MDEEPIIFKEEDSAMSEDDSSVELSKSEEETDAKSTKVSGSPAQDITTDGSPVKDKTAARRERDDDSQEERRRRRERERHKKEGESADEDTSGKETSTSSKHVKHRERSKKRTDEKSKHRHHHHHHHHHHHRHHHHRRKSEKDMPSRTHPVSPRGGMLAIIVEPESVVADSRRRAVSVDHEEDEPDGETRQRRDSVVAVTDVEAYRTTSAEELFEEQEDDDIWGIRQQMREMTESVYETTRGIEDERLRKLTEQLPVVEKPVKANTLAKKVKEIRSRKRKKSLPKIKTLGAMSSSPTGHSSHSFFSSPLNSPISPPSPVSAGNSPSDSPIQPSETEAGKKSKSLKELVSDKKRSGKKLGRKFGTTLRRHKKGKDKPEPVEPEGILETSGEIVRTLSTPSPRSVDFDTQPQPQAKNKIRSSTGYSSSLSPFAYQEKEIDSPVTAEARSFRAGSLPTVFLPPIPTPHRKKSLGFVYQLPLLGSPSTEFEGFEFSDEDGLGLSGDLSPKMQDGDHLVWIGVAICEFVSGGNNELAFKEGDKLVLFSDQEVDGWLPAQHVTTGDLGYVPGGFVKVVQVGVEQTAERAEAHMLTSGSLEDSAMGKSDEERKPEESTIIIIAEPPEGEKPADKVEDNSAEATQGIQPSFIEISFSDDDLEWSDSDEEPRNYQVVRSVNTSRRLLSSSPPPEETGAENFEKVSEADNSAGALSTGTEGDQPTAPRDLVDVMAQKQDLLVGWRQFEEMKKMQDDLMRKREALLDKREKALAEEKRQLKDSSEKEKKKKAGFSVVGILKLSGGEGKTDPPSSSPLEKVPKEWVPYFEAINKLLKQLRKDGDSSPSSTGLTVEEIERIITGDILGNGMTRAHQFPDTPEEVASYKRFITERLATGKKKSVAEIKGVLASSADVKDESVQVDENVTTRSDVDRREEGTSGVGSPNIDDEERRKRLDEKVKELQTQLKKTEKKLAAAKKAKVKGEKHVQEKLLEARVKLNLMMQEADSDEEEAATEKTNEVKKICAEEVQAMVDLEKEKIVLKYKDKIRRLENRTEATRGQTEKREKELLARIAELEQKSKGDNSSNNNNNSNNNSGSARGTPTRQLSGLLGKIEKKKNETFEQATVSLAEDVNFIFLVSMALFKLREQGEFYPGASRLWQN